MKKFYKDAIGKLLGTSFVLAAGYAVFDEGGLPAVEAISATAALSKTVIDFTRAVFQNDEFATLLPTVQALERFVIKNPHAGQPADMRLD